MTRQVNGRRIENLESRRVLTGGLQPVGPIREAVEISEAANPLDEFNGFAVGELDELATVEPGALSADLDGDGEVGLSDFLKLSENFGQTEATASDGDVNGDNRVGFLDFLELSGQYGQSTEIAETSGGSRELLEEAKPEEQPEFIWVQHLEHPEMIGWNDPFFCPPCGMG